MPDSTKKSNIIKKSNSVVQFISAAQTIDLRCRILRPGQPVENCQYVGDDDEQTFHLGALADAKIVSNGTFMKEKNKNFPESLLSYRLRGLATDSEFQKQGFGQLIINSAVQELLKRNCDLLWFNARVSAEEFYRKLGFSALPEIFDIPLAGPHKVMYKWFR